MNYKLLYPLCFLLLLCSQLTHSKSFYRINDSIIAYYEKQLTTTTTPSEKANLYRKLADYYSKKNKANLSFTNYKEAAKLYRVAKDTDAYMECTLELFYQIIGQQNLKNIDPLPYLKIYDKYSTTQHDPEKQLKTKFAYASYYFNPTNYLKSKQYYQEGLKLATSLKDSFSLAKLNTNLGLLYSGFVNQDSARVYYDNALKYYNKKNKNEIFSTYLNYANSYQKDKNYVAAIEKLKQAELIGVTDYNLQYTKILYRKLAKCYQGIGAYENAFNYLIKYDSLKDSINTTAQNIAITDIETKYQTEKKEKENLLLKNDIEKKQRTQLILWSVLIGFVCIGTVISYLIYKNTKRKQQLIIQERKLEVQKIEKQLKEQELNTIDTMLAGQEKERQRLAENLHDNLGSTLAAIKLNLQNIRTSSSSASETIENSTELINEAYEKVRSIAHEKSSGVMAKQGLLPAIQLLAKKVSSANGLQVKVEDFGLEKRLDNAIEITIFRIIQELITNIIKHAQATEATISLTNHDAVLNIIVDDNGKGFDIASLSHKDGMGLTNIEKRIEHLEGSMEIDSSSKRGTSIIINLPI